MTATASLRPAALARMASLDLTLQWRSGVHLAAAVATVAWIAVLHVVGPEVRRSLLPIAVYVDAGVVGFVFVGGLVLIERRDGALAALGVSPLRGRTYVAARLATLTALALVASFGVVIGSGAWADLGGGTMLVTSVVRRGGALATAVVLLSVPALLAGLLAAARATDVTRYVLLSQFAVVPVILPVLAAVDVVPDGLAVLVPTDAALQLLRLAVGADVSSARVVLGAVYGLVASFALGRWVLRDVRDVLFRGAGP